MSNEPILIKYKNAKGKLTERLVINLVTSFEVFNGREIWILRCVCCARNIPLIIPLRGVSFPS